MKPILIICGILLPSLLIAQDSIEYQFKNEFYDIRISINEKEGMIGYYHPRRGFIKRKYHLKGKRVIVSEPDNSPFLDTKLYFKKGRNVLVLKDSDSKYELLKKVSLKFKTT